MSKAKKKAKQQATFREGAYENRFKDHQERDEFAVLNRRTRERLSAMDALLKEQEAKAAHENAMQEKRMKALINLVLLVILCVVTCVGIIALAYTGAVAWWLSILLAVGLMMTCAFRSGWLWHEIKA